MNYRTTPLNMNLHKTFYLLFFLLTATLGSSAATLYVNAAAGGANTGTDWPNAYTSLQSALAAASSGDEIWVAAGLYKPSVQVDVNGSGGSDPREVTFQIPSGVTLYGGFAGGELLLSDRDWTVNLTILSGDIDNNDVNLDGNSIAETSNDIVGNNAYHVIYTQSVSALTRLDGFIVTAGEAGDFMPLGFSPNRNGGGWYNDDNPPGDLSSPTIENCHFSGNYADDRGGALSIGSFTAGTYAPTISNCEFTGNEAVRSGGALYLLGDASVVENCRFTENRTTNISGFDTGPAAGGAVYMSASNSAFTGCVFFNNSATGNPTGPFEGGGGGAVYVGHSATSTDNIGASFPHFVGCSFFDNHASGNGNAWGGAAVHYSDGGNLRVSYVNCVFNVNTASDDGGAVASFARTIAPPSVLDPILEPEFTNCTFYNNVADVGGALYFDGFSFMGTEMMSARIENCILHTNAATTSNPQVFNNASNLVAYSLIEGSGGSGGGWSASIGTDGGGNIDASPAFVNIADSDGPDNIPGNSDDGLALDALSPAVNTGNNAAAGLAGVTEDITGAARIQATTVDMGAYESPFAMNPCGAIPAGLTSADVGNTGGYPGSVCYDMGTYTVDASGSDIWGTQDGFHFVYRPMVGNGEIVVRIDQVDPQHPWNLAGVMMRESLNANSKNVLMAINAQGNAFMQRRFFTGWFTGILFGGGGGNAPEWVKLVRFGNFFAGYKSNNGVTWRRVGILFAPMPHTLLVGIATSTPLAGTSGTYEMSTLSIESIAYKTDPFDATLATEIKGIDGPREAKFAPLSPRFSVYPNPAADQATLEFVSEARDRVQIDLLDVSGRVLHPIFAGEVESGELHSLELAGERLAAGMYFIRLRGEQQQQVLQWVLTR